jgi:hypothetical protein
VRRNGNCGRSYWMRHAAGRSTWCWCGAWIVGADQWRTCSPHYKNWSISEWASCR